MSSNTMDVANQVMFNTYARFPLVLTRGEGCRLYDENDREYIDFVAGIAVCNLGHAHPRLVEAVCEQAQQLWHTSNLYYTRPQTELALWLTGHSYADKVFFCNSGAEANEAAIKLARKYFKSRSESGRFKNHYHGELFSRPDHGNPCPPRPRRKSAKGSIRFWRGLSICPLMISRPLLKAVDDQTAAIMIEPVQGEGGRSAAIT